MKYPYLILIAAALVLPAVAPLVAVAAEKAGDVVSVRGSAVIERQATQVKATLKAPLLEADSVVTMKRSRIKMLFRDDSVLTLGASSRLIIKQYLHNPKSKRVESLYDLADGKLRAVVGSAGFKVTTPTAFAAARGTVFITWFDINKNRTGIAVIEGLVSARNKDEKIIGEVVLKAGQMTFVPHLKPPGQPTPFNLKTDIEQDTDQGGASDVSGESQPDTLPLPPPPAKLDGAVIVNIIPTVPPTAQTQKQDISRVNLNLLFP